MMLVSDVDYDLDDFFRHVGCLFNVKNRSQTSQCCHQHRYSQHKFEVS